MSEILALSDSKARDAILSGIVDRDDGFRMPPPEAGKRPNKLKRTFPSKIVLDEDAYVEALSQIIERDYFPDTAKLRKHLDLLNAHETNDIVAISALHREILTEHRRSQSTPNLSQHHKRESWDGTDKINVDDSYINSNIRVDDMSVDKFLRIYTSEDNESFEKLQERDLEKWRKARHWAYEANSDEIGNYEQRPGMLMLYHMGGKVMTVQERKRFDSLLELPISVGDERSNNLDTWRFRVRNNLMFPPDLNDRISIQTNGLNSTTTALICNDSSGANLSLSDSDTSCSAVQCQSSSSLIKSTNKWVGSNDRPAKIIQRKNTNLRSMPDAPAFTYIPSGITPSPLERPHTPSVQSDSTSDSSSVYNKMDDRLADGNGIRKYRTISMTPSPMPGGNGGSPLMTWGTIGSTPLILDPYVRNEGSGGRTVADMTSTTDCMSLLSSEGTGNGFNGMTYQPPPMQQRELLALSLIAKEKSRKSAAKSSSDNTSNSNKHHSHSRSSSGTRTSSASVLLSSQQRRYQQLTPAAQSLAARLSGGLDSTSSRISGIDSNSDSRLNLFNSDALNRSYTVSRQSKSYNAITGFGRSHKHKRSSSSRSDDQNHIDNPQNISANTFNKLLNTDNLLNI